MIWQFLPIFLADLLFAAHIMRFHGLVPALLVVAFMGTLMLRKAWVPRLWQGALLLTIVEWLRVTMEFVRYRMAWNLPYTRLLIIMGVVIAYFVFIVFYFERQKIQNYFKKTSDQ